MISFKTYAILICMSICYLACQTTVKSSKLTEEGLANLICTCAQPIVKYNDQLRPLAAADDMGSLSQKMTEGDKIMTTAISCITDQLEKDVEQKERTRTYQLIEDQCQLDKRIAKDLMDKAYEFELPQY